MFQSTSNARDPMMSAIAGEDQHVWSCISLTVNHPWFLVTYVLHTPEGDIRETALLSFPAQFADLLSKNGNELTVIQLMLVSPRHLNKSDDWRMEPLAEIWRVTKGNSTSLTYRLADGRQYSDELGFVEPGEIKQRTCLVRFEQSRCSEK